MSDATDRLIERLSAEAGPVHRLPPPARRAMLWLLAVAVLAAIVIAVFSDLGVFARRARDPQLALDMIATLLTGIAAVIAAFELSLPDRAPAWMLLPLPPLAAWIATSGYGCYRHWISFGPDGWELGESTHCFRFILAVSLPLGVSLMVVLRRARPLAPVRVAAIGGLGVAAIAAFLLQFFHPFDVTLLDLSVHIVAIAIVIAVASLWARWSERREARP
ncbi:MAG TPA: NrsF family protein [Stellaceae bacterium]|nr:NrsF family protein [Stellaceae bacterium]